MGSKSDKLTSPLLEGMGNISGEGDLFKLYRFLKGLKFTILWSDAKMMCLFTKFKGWEFFIKAENIFLVLIIFATITKTQLEADLISEFSWGRELFFKTPGFKELVTDQVPWFWSDASHIVHFLKKDSIFSWDL